MTLSAFHRELAPAKINLALQIVRRLPNDYHELDSFVVFLKDGDWVEGEKNLDGGISLALEGPFARGIPVYEDNLVLRAAHLLRLKTGVSFGVNLKLQKNIPVGAGLGGGSADAAAVLRLLNRLWELDYTPEILAQLGKELGADVPSCVLKTPLRMQGIGEELSPIAAFPATDCVVAYPASPLLTSEVFRALPDKDFSGELPAFPAIAGDITFWKFWLNDTKNDLQKTAETLNPAIKPLLADLKEAEGSLFSRMSGSGSACFSLFIEASQAEAAAQALRSKHPDYWVIRSRILES